MRYLFLIMSILFLGLSCITGAQISQNTIEFYKYQDKLVEVPAEVTKINEVDNGEDTNYEVYVTYVYGNTKYLDFHWKRVNSDKEFAVGDEVCIKIDPENPRYIFKVERNDLYILMFGLNIWFASLFLGVSLYFFYENYRFKKALIDAKQIIFKASPNLNLGWMVLGFAAMLWTIKLTANHIFVNDLTIIIILLTIVGFALIILDMIRIKNFCFDDCKIYSLRCSSKWIVDNSDSESCYLGFNDNDKVRVSRKVYNKVSKGEYCHVLKNVKKQKTIAAFLKYDWTLCVDSSDYKQAKDEYFRMMLLINALLIGIFALAGYILSICSAI